jgi:hypothetical protein
VSKGNKPRQRLDGRIENSIKDVVRIDLLRILSERPASPRELAEILERDVNDILGHVVELWADNCIEAVAEDEPRGEEADRRYRTAPPFRVDDWEVQGFSLAERERLNVAVLQGIVIEALGARRSGSLDSRDDAHLSYKLLKLDDRGWRELVALLLRTLKEAETIEDGSRERLGLSGEEGLEAVVALMGYERSESRAG